MKTLPTKQSLQKYKRILYSQHYNSGFTLIELLVFAVIVSLLFGLGYANYRSYSQRQALFGIVRQVEGDLELAKNLANSGAKPSDCGDAQRLDGYDFVWDDSNHTYYIYPICNGVEETARIIRIVDSNAFSFSVVNSGFRFKTLGHGFDACPGTTCGSDEATITIGSISLSRTVVITISNSGDIGHEEI